MRVTSILELLARHMLRLEDRFMTDLSRLEATLARVESVSSAALAEVTNLRGEVAAKGDQIASLAAQIATLTDQLAAAQAGDPAAVDDMAARIEAAVQPLDDAIKVEA